MVTNLLDVRVSRKWFEAKHVCGFELVSKTGELLPSFSAGSHIDLHTPNGFVRQYSLCNNPQEQHRYLIGVLRDPRSRGGSRDVHDALVEGAAVRISAPRNHFELSPAKEYRLFAGGIGITPLLSMAEELARTDAKFTLHYCARSTGSMAFQERIAGSAFADCVELHFDDGPEGQKLDPDHAIGPPACDARLYVCGPKGFMMYITENAGKLGWPIDRIHLEHFESAQEAENGKSEPFEVELARSGRVLTVPRDKTIADVLLDNDIEIPLSCEAGVCGTCITPLISGQPDHRDVCLSEEQRSSMITPCCSRALSGRLVIDL